MHDSLIGAVLLLLSLAVLWHIQSFPDAPGQTFGPALFPGVIAAGLALVSGALIWRGLREPDRRWFSIDAGLRSGRHLLAFLTAIGSMLFYIALADTLGFIVCGTAILVTLQWACGVPWRLNLLVALIATLAIHGTFYKLLKVPLPWGLLERFAW